MFHLCLFNFVLFNRKFLLIVSEGLGEHAARVQLVLGEICFFDS